MQLTSHSWLLSDMLAFCKITPLGKATSLVPCYLVAAGMNECKEGDSSDLGPGGEENMGPGGQEVSSFE